MPTITTSRLPPPTSWDEFEEICKSAFSLRWANPNLARHGRQGQKQDGVDIYGIDSLQNFVGVQCKNTTTSISEKIVDGECLKAEKFEPTLTALYIATTADRDVNIQAYARQLSAERRKANKFPVDVVFWQDIIHDLSRDELPIRQHYPQYFGQQPASPAQLMRANVVLNITSLFDVIDFQAISEHLSWGAKYIHFSIIEHLTQIESIRNSPVFNIHNQALLSSVDALINSWRKLTSLIGQAPYNSNNHDNTLIFNMPGDFCRNKEENDLFENIDSAINELMHSIRSFCQLINTNYLEINFEKTSAKARRLY
jgi:hypothetical protein